MTRTINRPWTERLDLARSVAAGQLTITHLSVIGMTHIRRSAAR